jgi:soluble lytic murein transglycosylase-like protein
MKTTRILAAAALSLLTASWAAAESPKPFADFSAKRVKPPTSKATVGKRITVQIDPSATPAAVAAPSTPPAQTALAPAPAPKAPLGKYVWFWDKVSPNLGQSAPNNLEIAMSAIAGAAQPVRAPRLQALQDIATLHGKDILLSTINTKVSPALVLAVISVESAGKADAISSAGATGLMQLMPATAERFGVTDRTVATDNIAGGVKYLDWLMGEFKGDPIMVLAGYNAGEGNVRKHDGVPPFAETRDYVPKVLAAFQVAKGLCLTPPELVSDGCVFAAMN